MSHKNGTSDRIKALSLFIAQNATQVSELRLGSKPNLTSGELDKMTQAVSDACRELEALLTEPHEWLAQVAWGYMDSVALSVVLEMNIHRHIQAGEGQTSLAQLADITGGSIDLISKDNLRVDINIILTGLCRKDNAAMCEAIDLRRSRARTIPPQQPLDVSSPS
jgi:hypothetical protein